MISHWDEARTWRGERDHIAGPRSGKVFFVGLGLVARLGAQVDYWDGED